MSTMTERELLPKDVRLALDRMCHPLDESVLTGETAKEDARCMKIIRDFIYSKAALTQQQEAEPVGEIPEGFKVCPISGRPFWGNIEHPELGLVATYGGPFDTYTIPAVGEDGELRCERFDQDDGWWIEGGEPFGWLYQDQQPEHPPAAQALTEQEQNDMGTGAKWRQDSSLETWFPYTAQRLAELEAKAAQQQEAEPVGYLSDANAGALREGRNTRIYAEPTPWVHRPVFLNPSKPAAQPQVPDMKTAQAALSLFRKEYIGQDQQALWESCWKEALLSTTGEQ